MLEKTLESLLDCKDIQPVHTKGNQSWIFIGRTVAETESPILCLPDAELTHLKRPWCWERLKAGGEEDDWGWDGQMASPMWWTWVWVGSRSWWWTGRPGVLQSIGSQRVVERLNWTEHKLYPHYLYLIVLDCCPANSNFFKCPQVILICSQGRELLIYKL